MAEIGKFINTIIEHYNAAGPWLEEDQKLPPRKVLLKVCHVLLDVSTMREEGRYPSFRVCFIDPYSELINMYLHSHTLLFEKPIEFSTKELHRLAPALNPNISYLMLDTRSNPYKIIGINASYTMWENILLKASNSGNRMPRIPNFFLKGPGEVDACIGETTLLSFRSGVFGFYRTDVFTSTYIADELKRNSDIDDEDRLRVLYRILWKAMAYNHGGSIFIVPSEEACKEHLSIKYRIPSAFAFGIHDDPYLSPDGTAVKEVITYADILAKFTSVDGAVVLNKNLELIGFGAESIIADQGVKEPLMCFIGYDDQEKKMRRFNDQGMRHRVCYRLCSMVEGTVAIIISQDGSVECCTKKNGKVIVYDNISLPLM